MTKKETDATREADKNADKVAPTQPGPTYDNPNEDNDGTGTHGDGPAPSTGNTAGGGSPDTSGAPAGTV